MPTTIFIDLKKFRSFLKGSRKSESGERGSGVGGMEVGETGQKIIKRKCFDKKEAIKEMLNKKKKVKLSNFKIYH